MRNYIGVFIIAVLLILIYFEFKPSGTLPSSAISTSAATAVSEKPADYTATFAIFTNNSLRVLNDPKYHNLSKDSYLESGDPSIIRIKKTGISWESFFKTLPIELTEDCLSLTVGEMYCNGQGGTLKFYINNKRVTNIFALKIHKDDKLLVSYGYETVEEIKSQLDRFSETSDL